MCRGPPHDVKVRPAIRVVRVNSASSGVLFSHLSLPVPAPHPLLSPSRAPAVALMREVHVELEAIRKEEQALKTQPSLHGFRGLLEQRKCSGSVGTQNRSLLR